MTEAARGANSGPGYAKKPDYRIDMVPAGKQVRVEVNGQVIADSANVMLMQEQNHKPVCYFPMSDIEMAHFERTDHSTHCPFKGDASYWTLTVGERVLEDVMWGYETPCDEVSGIKGYVALYRDRIDNWYEDGELLLGSAHGADD
ncbi:MAG: DUF427 domain-containing protein [Alphaproteobacteria bacterium]|nr:DUF427 domain-containing protein [Alphaproteobacteria bacterium]